MDPIKNLDDKLYEVTQTGCLDGLTILRFAHAFESGGGLEQYIEDLNRILLNRNRLTIIQVQLTDKIKQAGTIIEESSGEGHIIRKFLLAKRFRQSDPLINLNLFTKLKNNVQSVLKHKVINNKSVYPIIKPLLVRYFPTKKGSCEPEGADLEVRQILDQYKVDIALIHSPGGQDSRKIISEIKTHQIPCAIINHFSNDQFLNISLRIQTEAVDGVAGVNEIDVPEYLRSNFFNVSDGIDTEFFSRDNIKDIKDQVEIPKILLPARVIESKGHKDLIAAADVIRKKGFSLELKFAGRCDDKNYENELKKLLTKAGFNANETFTGFCTAESMRKNYAESYAVVLPTYHHEGLGRVLCEAQAMSKPVIAYDIGGIREAFQDNITGILVPLGDVKKLTAALVNMLQDIDLAYKMGRTGRVFVEERFSLKALSEKHERFYIKTMRSARICKE